MIILFSDKRKEQITSVACGDTVEVSSLHIEANQNSQQPKTSNRHWEGMKKVFVLHLPALLTVLPGSSRVPLAPGHARITYRCTFFRLTVMPSPLCYCEPYKHYTRFCPLLRTYPPCTSTRSSYLMCTCSCA